MKNKLSKKEKDEIENANLNRWYQLSPTEIQQDVTGVDLFGTDEDAQDRTVALLIWKALPLNEKRTLRKEHLREFEVSIVRVSYSEQIMIVKATSDEEAKDIAERRGNKGYKETSFEYLINSTTII